jgi:flagellar biosynthesis/type III secretory pathway protein FliH
MPDAFVLMREWLQPVQPAQPEQLPQPDPVPAAIDGARCEEDEIDDVDRAIEEARRFRAALADALSYHANDLVTDIASEIVARELRCAPCDVARIVERAIERYAIEPVRVRVNPADAAIVAGRWVTVCDEELRRGDAVIETSAGTIDATLGARLQRVLAKVRV